MDESKAVNRVIAFSGFLGLLQGVNRFLVPIALLQFGWDLEDYALVFLTQALSMALPFLFAGFIADLKGRKQTIAISFLLFAVGTYGFVLTIKGDSIFAIIIAQMIITVAFGLARVRRAKPQGAHPGVLRRELVFYRPGRPLFKGFRLVWRRQAA